MQNGLFEKRLLSAAEIEKNYEFEKIIRRASTNKALKCPDPDCQSPVIRYCHGNIKKAYFSHLSNAKCDYARYDQETDESLRNVIELVYERLSSSHKIQREVKTLSHHYTPLLIIDHDGTKIALEIISDQLAIRPHETLLSQFAKASLQVQWIIVSDVLRIADENKVDYLRRYQLNESPEKFLLLIAKNGKTVLQCKLDTKKYVYRGQSFKSNNYPSLYVMEGSLDDIVMENHRLTLQEFQSEFKSWKLRKEEAFIKKVIAMEKEKEEFEKRLEVDRVPQTHHSNGQGSDVNTKQEVAVENDEISKRADTISTNVKDQEKSISDFELNERVIPQLMQQEYQVKDSLNRRWIKCKSCGHVGMEKDFKVFGGQGKINLGTCHNCVIH